MRLERQVDLGTCEGPGTNYPKISRDNCTEQWFPKLAVRQLLGKLIHNRFPILKLRITPELVNQNLRWLGDSTVAYLGARI